MLVLVCSSVDLSALVLVSVGSLVAFLSLALVLASWARSSLYSMVLVVLLILYICWSVVVFVGTGGGTGLCWWWGHSSFVLVALVVVALVLVVGAFIIRTGGVHHSYWWRSSFMLVHWCWWRLSFILVALVLAAFVVRGVGAGGAHVGAVRAGVVPMMVFVLQLTYRAALVNNQFVCTEYSPIMYMAWYCSQVSTFSCYREFHQTTKKR